MLAVGAFAEVGGHLVGVVDGADDHGLVGVAFHVVDDDFLSDPRPGVEAPAPTGDGLDAANPARAFFVVLALTVPVELDLHAAVFIGIDFLALGSDDHGGLRPLDDRLGSDALRTERHGRGKA